jgi:iron-sulfur cluster assembly protein
VSLPVLTLTDNAAELVKSIAEASPELPDDSGLRIQGEASEEHGLALQLTMADGPDEGDEVIEEAGVRVFVEAEAAAFLDDKVLDANVVGDRVQFSLSEQV